VSDIVLHGTKSTGNEVGGKGILLLMLVTLFRTIESISEFCLPSRTRNGAGDEDLYPVIVFVVSI
jgi:hypothetical protein